MILATDWRSFLALAGIAIALMLISDWGGATSYSTSLLFPFFYFFKSHSYISLVILALVCSCVMIKHRVNIARLQEGKEPSVRMAVKKTLHLVEDENYTEL